MLGQAKFKILPLQLRESQLVLSLIYLDELGIQSVFLEPVTSEILRSAEKSGDGKDLAIPRQEGGNEGAIDARRLGGAVRV